MHCLTKSFMSLCQVKKFKILEHLLHIQHCELKHFSRRKKQTTFAAIGTLRVKKFNNLLYIQHCELISCYLYPV